MAQDNVIVAFGAADLSPSFYVMRPDAAMARAGMPRHMRELPLWRMAAALQIDMAKAISTEKLSSDQPLDLLVSMARRCGACDEKEACLTMLRATADRLSVPPGFCRIKNRFLDLRADLA
jgi:hypothetical protein